MPDVNDILAQLRRNRQQIDAALGPDDRATFEQRRAALSAAAVADTEGQHTPALTAEALELVGDFPAVADLLRADDPSLLPEPSRGPGPGVAAPEHEGALPAVPAVAPQGAGSHAEAAVSPAAAPVPGRATWREGWTPELSMQAFKEGVSAVMGLCIVGVTLYLAVRILDDSGNTQRSADSRAVLTVVVGLAGAVLGYYFGRVPAEAQATQARKESHAAVASAQEVGSTAQALADEADRALQSADPTRAGAPLGGGSEAMAQRRRELREAMGRLPRG